MSRSLLTALVFVASWFASAPALAAETSTLAAEMPNREDVSEDHPGHRHAMHPNLVGAKFGYISLFAPHEGEYEHLPLGYIGLFYERSVIHNWLEIELTVAGAAGREELGFPIDLYFKKPFHPSPRITPYIGLGPHADLIIEPERRLLLGGCVTIGAYIWFSQRWGMDIDFDYAVAANRGEVFHDVLLAVGPTARF